MAQHRSRMSSPPIRARPAQQKESSIVYGVEGNSTSAKRLEKGLVLHEDCPHGRKRITMSRHLQGVYVGLFEESDENHLSDSGLYFDELPGVFDVSSALVQDREAANLAVSLSAPVLLFQFIGQGARYYCIPCIV